MALVIEKMSTQEYNQKEHRETTSVLVPRKGLSGSLASTYHNLLAHIPSVYWSKAWHALGPATWHKSIQIITKISKSLPNVVSHCSNSMYVGGNWWLLMTSLKRPSPIGRQRVMLQILFLNGRYVFLLSGVKSSLMLNKTKQKTSKYRILHQHIAVHLTCTLGWQPRKAS